MSGGSMNYLYRQVAEVAVDLGGSQSTHRQAFGAALAYAALALRAVEWSDSSDGSEEKAEEAITQFLHAKKLPLEAVVAITQIEKATNHLKTLYETVADAPSK